MRQQGQTVRASCAVHERCIIAVAGDEQVTSRAPGRAGVRA